MKHYKEIKGYENYLISNEGRVYSCKRKKFLKPRKHRCGYFQIGLRKNGVRKFYIIHRLVANAFIPNPENKRTVNHIDGCKTNNHASNLEWATDKENIRHAMDTGLRDNKGSKNGRVKLSENQVLEIRRLYKTGDYSQRGLAKMFCVHQTIIGRIIRRELWNHI